MGLLDNLLYSTNANFGGQNAGLLDMLNTFQMQNSQYQPSAGFQPVVGANQPSPLDTAQYPAGPIGAPSNAMAQAPQAQNPIAVGNYQMPRIGDPSQFAAADDAALPQNAQPTQGQIAPQQTLQAPQIAAPTPGVSDRLIAGLQGFANGGALLPALANGISGLATGQRADKAGIAQQSANMTARALLAKGVDPAAVQAAITNPELMKTLITQTYGPQTVQSIGNGYVWDPKKGAAVKAYEPDDKIPVGFQKTDNGLQPIPGGPADPAYLRLKAAKEKDPNAVNVLGRGGELYKLDANGNPVIVHKNESETALLDDQTTSAMASQYLAGDKSVMTNLGRGGQGAANIIKLRTEIYKQAQAAGLNGRDIVDNFNEQAGALAGQRAVGTRAANISLAANEANNMIPIALAASDKLPRSQYMPWNQMVQAVQKGSSSPELASFVAATNSLVNSYVRAVSPSGVPTDSMREHAYSMLNAAQGPEAYKAVIETMKQEMKAALEAPSQVKKELRHKSEEPATQPAMTGKTKSGVSWGVIQ